MSDTAPPAATLPRPLTGRRALVALALAVVAIAAALAAVLVPGAGSHPRATHRTHRARLVAEAPDPLADQSFPDPAGAARHAKAAPPATFALSPGAPSNSQVEQEKLEEQQIDHSLASHSPASLVDPVSGAFTPRNVVPLKIQQVIAGGNAIADFPYVYGGGHGSFVDRAYDCSGSVSYALAAAGLIAGPETSGQLEHWGRPGPGRYLTVFANAGHTFMRVDGVWFDTAGRAGPYSTRWLTREPSLGGYVIRHYPGL
jgi:cell wall-associated NlpC family hydrolase